jgi:hypothetical protein
MVKCKQTAQSSFSLADTPAAMRPLPGLNGVLTDTEFDRRAVYAIGCLHPRAVTHNRLAGVV